MDQLCLEILVIEQALDVGVQVVTAECPDPLVQPSLDHEALGFGQLDPDLGIDQFGN